MTITIHLHLIKICFRSNMFSQFSQFSRKLHQSIRPIFECTALRKNSSNFKKLDELHSFQKTRCTAVFQRNIYNTPEICLFVVGEIFVCKYCSTKSYRRGNEVFGTTQSEILPMIKQYYGCTKILRICQLITSATFWLPGSRSAKIC